MKHPNKEITGFDFQIIPLAEARPMVLAGAGNYADLKAKILDILPTLEPDQAFTFGLPSKDDEIPEYQRRGICIAINSTLRKAGFSYAVTYTNTKRLFVLIPKESKAKKKNDKIEIPNAPPTPIKTPADLVEFAREFFKTQTFSKTQRKAVMTVGYTHLGMRLKDMQPVFKLTKGGIRFVVVETKIDATKEIEKLLYALENRGQ